MLYEKVELTPEEKEIFKLLLETNEHFNLGATLRAAGGWVRDKLLGKCSDDIDIALDNMLGKAFAEKVNEYLTIKGEETHKIGLIETNPEQSKHLETARVRIRDTWIDLVNLRSETYACDSRIPEMCFGTPEQDAYRRDLTINSMFYNINTSSIEDFTKKGIMDLEGQIIRTPLAPRETFLDDPLRVLRAVRFCARFGFELEPDLVEAAASEEVRAALRDKVSRERVGVELEGMIKSAAPVFAVQQLIRLRHFNSVFPIPANASLPETIDCAPSCLAAMQTVGDVLTSLPTEWLSDEERRICLLAALLLPLRDVNVSLKKGKQGPLAAYIIKESLKIRSKDADLVAVVHSCAVGFASIAAALSVDGAPRTLESTGSGDYPEEYRVEIGKMMKSIQGNWRIALPLAAIMDSPCAASLMEETSNGLVALDRAGSSTEPHRASDQKLLGEHCDIQRQRRANLCRNIEEVVRLMELQDAWSIKPLMNGKEIMQFLQMKQAGPQLGQITKGLLEWQYAHPRGTVEQCQEWLRAAHSERAC